MVKNRTVVPTLTSSVAFVLRALDADWLDHRALETGKSGRGGGSRLCACPRVGASVSSGNQLHSCLFGATGIFELS